MAFNNQPLEYLEGLSGVTFQKLYQEPATALSIFRRMLPRLAQSIVMANLFLDEPFLEPDLRAWFRPESRNARMKSLTVLERLHIMTKMKTAEGVLGYQLSASFAKSLREALTGSSSGNPFGTFFTLPEETKVDIPFLDEVAKNRWEMILYYIVGSAGAGGGDGQYGGGGGSVGNLITRKTKKILELGNFVQAGPNGPTITKEGFSFLLQDVNSQIWSLLIVYLQTYETGTDGGADGDDVNAGSATAPSFGNGNGDQMDPIDLLGFLFKLGTFQLGQAYSTKDLTRTQLAMLDQLSDFGLIYRRDRSAPYFYPTRLVTTLASDAPALITVSDRAMGRGPGRGGSGPAGAAGVDSSTLVHDAPTSTNFIVVETNYRLYAYVTSPIQICILALFVRLHTRFPNMVSGKITKESIGAAFERGITADQIIVYLQRHAHPQMRKSPLILPPTVVDQIKLWQIDGDQLLANDGFLVNQFSGRKEYEDVKKYAQSLGVLVWSSDEKMACFVTQLEQLRAYLASRQMRQQQQQQLQQQQQQQRGQSPAQAVR